MDKIESLGNTISNLTLYDIKSMYTQAKNVVFNVSEMEAKVREATNEDPWGASSTLMQDIAQGTFNFQQFNEIMPCIYSQFMEKEARQWRQIYKALQLLEYLIKHGSERVVDDARSHLSTLKMLRSFHYIDEKGKDQGINVRNRSKELVELLADVEKIRLERKKAKANRTKYVGTGNDGLSFGSSRYGGFGNDSLGSYSGEYGTNASGYDREYSGGGSSGGFRDNVSRRNEFEQYDAGDDETSSPRRSTTATTTSQPRSSTTQSKALGKAPEPVPAPVMNLLDFDDNEPGAGSSTAGATTSAAKEKALPALAPLGINENAGGEDDFADFQAAPSSPPAVPSMSIRPLGAAPVAAAPAKPSLMDLLATTSTPVASKPIQSSQPQAFGALNATLSSTSSQVRPSSTPATAPTYAAMPAMNPISPRSALTSPVSSTASSSLASTSTKRGGSVGGGGFDDLWTMSLGSAGASKSAGGSGGAKSMKDLEKEKAQAGIWGTQNQTRPPAAAAGTASSAGGFGSFVKPAGPSNSGGGAPGGADDLLL